MARAGRKRKQGVERYPSGEAKKSNVAEMPFNTENIVETGDRGKKFLRRKTELEQMGCTQAQQNAGLEIHKLWRLCRVHYLDAPSIDAKVSNPNGGYGHAPQELDDNQINFGVEVHRRYQNAIRAVSDSARDAQMNPKIVLKALLGICVENKPATQASKEDCIFALRALVQHFKF